MPYHPYGIRRPGGVTVVIALTWIVAFLSMVSGFLAIAGEDARIGRLRLNADVSVGIGIAELAFGVISALVAIGLARRSALARLLVSALMLTRIIAGVWIAIQYSGPSSWLQPALAAGIAFLILLLLWNPQAGAYFNR